VTDPWLVIKLCLHDLDILIDASDRLLKETYSNIKAHPDVSVVQQGLASENKRILDREDGYTILHAVQRDDITNHPVRFIRLQCGGVLKRIPVAVKERD
jgi:hypothetical protein